MISLLPSQSLVLRYIIGSIEARGGIAPSLAEIALSTGKYKSHTHRNLAQLVERGYIKRKARRARWIDVLEPMPIPRGPNGEPLFFVQTPRI